MLDTVQSNGAANTAARNPFAKAEDIGDIQSRFLELLVAQLRNQDPLAPMDNAQVTSQMAQLNTVSGIQNLNKTMEGLGQVIAAGQFSQAVALVDKLVLVKGDGMVLADGQAGAQYKADQPYDTAVATIKNAGGVVVREINLGRVSKGMNELVWDGRSNDGTAMPPGQYRLEVQGTRAGESTKLETYRYDIIQSLDNSATGQFTLTTSQGDSISINDIVKVY
ncbi:MAG TPA: flagellar hook capping FlgD N-terminal domain-containing protein [Limnobacter sp.]|nr:flagellar hook capping FlgD N-terminal domain-containing protein [Limnobacter sp.]